jgi:hypothetical protein
MTAVVGLTVAAPIEPWQQIGLRVVDDVSWIGGVRLRFVSPTAGGVVGTGGLVSWQLSGAPGAVDLIDGLATTHEAEAPALTDTAHWQHDLGATSFDHVVVMTSSLERTCAAIESATGEPLKRIREAGPVRQGFHRLSPIIVEVVESSQVTSGTASFWGFVLVVDDLHDAAARLGPDVISLPKPAVQPGRFIASFRNSAGLGLPLALMTP